MADPTNITVEPLKNVINQPIKPSIKSGHIAMDGGSGTISRHIGTGEQAKDSFIWTTLKYCFYLGAVFSVCLILVYFHYALDKGKPDEIDIISELKDVWSIFTPILTLALGYAFGKREKE